MPNPLTSTNILQGKFVVVVGGSRGIGFAIARHCLALGASVGLIARNSTELHSAARELQISNPQSKIKVATADISQGSEVKSAFAHLLADVDCLHALVCTAAVIGPLGPLSSIAMEDFSRSLDVNVTGALRCIQMVLPQLAKRGGRIILFSGGGQGALPGQLAYVASKGSIWRLTETLAEELRGQEIYVNAIAPGMVDTKMTQQMIAAGPQNIGERFFSQSQKKIAHGGDSPLEAAKLVEFLLSERSGTLSGKILSAIWDPYDQFDLSELQHSDIYTFKRVIDTQGGTRFN